MQHAISHILVAYSSYASFYRYNKSTQRQTLDMLCHPVLYQIMAHNNRKVLEVRVVFNRVRKSDYLDQSSCLVVSVNIRRRRPG